MVRIGLDIYQHGEDAYPLVAYKNEWEEIKFQEELEKAIEELLRVEAELAEAQESWFWERLLKINL